MRSRYIQNRIFALLSDCKRHTVKEIAEKLEINESTVYRHIQDLSANYMITTFIGGREHGGTQLVDLKGNNILSKDEIKQVIAILTKNEEDYIITEIIRKLKALL